MSATDGHAQGTTVSEANAPGGANPTLLGDPLLAETSECLKLVSGLEQDSQVLYHLDVQKNLLTVTSHSGHTREFPVDVAYQLQIGKQLKSFSSYLNRQNVQIVKKSTGELTYRRIRANAQPPEPTTQVRPDQAVNWLMDQNTTQIQVNKVMTESIQKTHKETSEEFKRIHNLIEAAKEEAAKRDASIVDELTVKMNALGEDVKNSIREMLGERSRTSHTQQWVDESQGPPSQYGPGIEVPEMDLPGYESDSPVVLNRPRTPTRRQLRAPIAFPDRQQLRQPLPGIIPLSSPPRVPNVQHRNYVLPNFEQSLNHNFNPNFVTQPTNFSSNCDHQHHSQPAVRFQNQWQNPSTNRNSYNFSQRYGQPPTTSPGRNRSGTHPSKMNQLDDSYYRRFKIEHEKYDGSTSFTDWLTVLEGLFTLHRIPTHRYTEHAIGLFEGTARSTIHYLMQEYPQIVDGDWPLFKQKCLEQFTNSSDVTSGWVTGINCVQREGERVASYVKRKIKAIQGINIDSESKAGLIVASALPLIKTIVCNMNVKLSMANIEHILQKASEEVIEHETGVRKVASGHEGRQSRHRTPERRSDRYRHRSTSRHSNRSNQSDRSTHSNSGQKQNTSSSNWSSNDRTPPSHRQAQDKAKTTKKCFKCGKEGHEIKDCRVKGTPKPTVLFRSRSGSGSGSARTFTPESIPTVEDVSENEQA